MMSFGVLNKTAACCDAPWRFRGGSSTPTSWSPRRRQKLMYDEDSSPKVPLAKKIVELVPFQAAFIGVPSRARRDG
jgi:hypothetical protein